MQMCLSRSNREWLSKAYIGSCTNTIMLTKEERQAFILGYYLGMSDNDVMNGEKLEISRIAANDSCHEVMCELGIEDDQELLPDIKKFYADIQEISILINQKLRLR